MLIPKIIWQTYKTSYDDLPGYAKEAAQTWQEMNPDYEYRYMTDEEVYAFVLEHFGQDVVDLMKSFKVPVMRADLWRYLVVYIYGGIYADLDTLCQAPAEEWIPANAKMVIAPENGVHYAQWCFAATPKHPAIKSIIDLVLERCKDINYSMPSFIHYHTANKVFSDGIRKYFNLPDIEHPCERMETEFNCWCGFLQEEVLTYSTNKQMLAEGLFCHSGDDWDMFREKGVKHLFGSNNWRDGNYQRWTKNALAAKSRGYFDE
jgi:mannosyltransferase OCH1-like enzyme